MSNERAVAHFQAAREHYLARRFAEARATMQRYRQAIDYNQFERSDLRDTQAPRISVIVVSFHSGLALLDCLKSVIDQQGSRFEVILVDNGGNQSIHTEITTLPLLWIRPPVNLLPSEGRNLGAHFARGDLLVFLDDDALMTPGYLAEACRTLDETSILAVRGRVLPKTASPHVQLPQQYDLGEIPRPAELNLEGNCVIRRAAYAALQGFDPLLFGHEGKELTLRCLASYSQQKILYWPTLVIRHDYAQAERLAAKRKRQSLASDYLQYLKESSMDAGVSILVRAGDNVTAADEFLASLLKHNTHKPIEVLLFATKSQQALTVSRSYLPHLFVRVLGPNTSSLGRIAQQARYSRLLVIDVPCLFASDLLTDKGQKRQGDFDGSFILPREQAAALTSFPANVSLEELSRLEKAAVEPAVPQKSDLKRASDDADVAQSHIMADLGNQNQAFHQQLDNDEFIQRYGWLKPPILPKRIPPLENTSDNFSNKEVHHCSLFSPYQPTKKKRTSPFKILSIVSDRLQDCLSYDAEIIRFDLNEWETQLALSPTYVLIESVSQALQMEGNASFCKFIDACRRQKIPTVFWHTDARENCSMYCDLAKVMDYVVAVEQDSVAYYTKQVKVPVRLLEHAIQPALHNAIRDDLPRPAYSNTRFFFDGWADLIEFRNEYESFLQPLNELGLHIFESKWQFMKNKLPETPQFIKNIHGALNYRERLSAVKHFDVCIMATPSMKSSSALTLDALEIISTKRVVLFRGEGLLPMITGLVRQCGSDDEFIAEARRLIDYPAYRDECAHKAWRIIHIHHTFVNRLNTLAELLDLPERIGQFPSVASITVTKRPELLVTNAKINYLQQTVPRKEWVIVLNTLDANVDQVEKDLENIPNIRIYQVSSDKNIGFCLNMAIGKCQSDYWAKMDDDDFYGPNYLMDYLLNIESGNFDLIGKVPAFTYFEQEDSIYLRQAMNWGKINVIAGNGNLRMCGATFCGKKDLPNKVKFSESIRSAVDSTWYADCVSAGMKIAFSDDYEMTVFRGSDKSRHTWRTEDDDLKKNAVFVSKGNERSKVNI